MNPTISEGLNRNGHEVLLPKLHDGGKSISWSILQLVRLSDKEILLKVPVNWLLHQRRLHVFGTEMPLALVGRDEKLAEIESMMHVECKKHSQRRSGYFLFASPGVGKTRLFDELYKKNLSSQTADRPMYVIIDFNGGFGKFSATVQNIIKYDSYESLIEIFPLLRAYHSEAIDDTYLNFQDFLDNIAILIKSCGNDIDEIVYSVKLLKKAIWAYFCDRCASLGYSNKLIFLVDEIVKTREYFLPRADGKTWPEYWRSTLCAWADTKLAVDVVAVVFSTLDTSLMIKEVGDSGRTMNSISLPLLSIEDSVLLLDAALPASQISFNNMERDTALKLMAVYAAGHCRSLEFLVDKVVGLAIHQQELVWNVLQDMVRMKKLHLKSVFPVKQSHPEILKVLLKQLFQPEVGEDLESRYVKVSPGSCVSMWSLVQRGVLVGTYDSTPAVSLIVLLALSESLHVNDPIRMAMNLFLHPLPHAKGLESVLAGIEILRGYAFPNLSLVDSYNMLRSSKTCFGSDPILRQPLQSCSDCDEYIGQDELKYDRNVLYSSTHPTKAGWDLVSVQFVEETKSVSYATTTAVSEEQTAKKRKLKERTSIVVFRQITMSDMEVDETGVEKLTALDVKRACDHCKVFADSSIFVDGEASSRRPTLPHAVVFIALKSINASCLVPKDNVIIIAGEDQLEASYGRTLLKLLRVLVQCTIPTVGN